MKTKAILKEAIIWIIIALPVIYYFAVRQQLPEQVPIHFDVYGNPDNWMNKNGFLWLVLGMTLGVYLLMAVIPLIDPKHRIQEMGGKYYAIKLVMVTLMSAMSGFMIYTAINSGADKKFIIFALISALFIVFGNFMPALKPNYFIGIRTPWTLEDQDNWRKTHRFTGYFWTIGGLVMLISGFFLPEKLFPLLLVLVLILAFVPIIYSFVLFLRQKDGNMK